MRIQDAVEHALELSRAEECIVLGYESTSANVRWANTTSTTNGTAHGTSLYVVSISGGRVGSLGRSSLTPESVEELVRSSEAACEGNPEAEDRMPLLPGTDAVPDWDDPHPHSGIEVFRTFAPALGAVFERARAEGTELFGYAEHDTSTLLLATSTGLRRRHTQREGLVELTGKTPDFATSSWSGRLATSFEDVDPDVLYERVRQRLDWSKASIEVPAGRYEVLLEPSCVADMLVYAYWSASAREADEGRSVYSKPGGGNRIGEKIAAEAVSLYSDPAEPGLEVAPFQATPASSSYASVFDNGLPISRTDWITGGVLRALATTRHWAQASGAPGPVPFVQNLILPAAGPSLDEMIASTSRALLVTCLWYIRTVDPRTLLLTGLTRDGVFLVEDGEVKGAVHNFRFNESPIDMLARTVQTGASEITLAREFGDYFRFTKMPPLRVEGFNMSSVSAAT